MSDRRKKEFNKKYIWGSHDAGGKWNKATRENAIKLESLKETDSKRLEFIDFIYLNLVGQLNVDTIIEIGSGSGLLGKLLSNDSRFNEIKYIGADICLSSVEQAKEAFPNLNFIHLPWEKVIHITDQNNFILVASGTLECFTNTEIKSFLAKAQKNNFCKGIALFEPINMSLDDQNIESLPRGGFAYSHNYHLLLNQAKYQQIKIMISQSSAHPTTKDLKCTAKCN